MLKLSQSITTSELDWRISSVLPTLLMLALPETTLPPCGWLVALKAKAPQAGAAHGAAAGAPACAGAGAALASAVRPSGERASEIAAATPLRPAIERARPDLPRPDFARPLEVSATGTQALRTSLKISRYIR